MFEIEIPETIFAEHLDRRLAQGWFRSGPVLFRADRICIEDRIHPLVHVRLPLSGHAPGRNSRRLLRRNRERFRVAFGPARITAAHRRLYEATKPRFTSFVSRTLEPVVLGELPAGLDTRECSVWDGRRLVAVSYFDLGARSVASLLALHDPAYARTSPGFFTLLEEIEWAREHGLRFFYPGYVIPGLPAFDYKLRIGAVQYLEGSRWRRRTAPPRGLRAVDRFVARVGRLERALARAGLQFLRRAYAGFWMGHLDAAMPAGLLREHVHLRVLDADARESPLVIEVAGDETKYTLRETEVVDDLDLMADFEPVGGAAAAWELRGLRCLRELRVSASAREIASAAREAVAPPAPHHTAPRRG